MTTPDPFDRLRDADPLAGRRLPDPADHDAVVMRDAILDADVTPLEQVLHRRRRWLVGGVAVAAAVATAAALAVRTAPVTDPTSVGCYDAASTQASTIVIAASDASPVEQCRELWESGDVVQGVTADTMPPLTACVLDEGQVGVFPATSCDEIDRSGRDVPPWSPPEVDLPDVETPVQTPVETPSAPSGEPTEGLPLPDFGTDDVVVRDALAEINTAMLDRCLTLEQATALAERILADAGLEGWAVEPVVAWPDGDVCAGFFPDAAEQAVRFVPEEPAPGQTPED